MDRSDSRERSYWRLLAAAEAALDASDFADAEQSYERARDRRGDSPGRVFFTEKLSDAVGRMLRRNAPAAPGRWARREAAFAERFRQEGETRVRAGVRLAELRPEDNAEANQPVLVAALHLVARSRLFPEEPGSAVILLKGLFRTAHRTGQPFDPFLLRHDLPLKEEDRLWLARKGAAMLEVFLEHGHLARGTEPAEEWADAVMSFLDPRYFAAGERLEEERAWLEAVSADRLLGRAGPSVELYRSYLALDGSPGPRSDEARVRLLEILANIDDVHFPVPRYDEALRALQWAGLAPGSEVAGRYQAALARLEYRRPDLAAADDRAWSTVAAGTGGRLVCVLWWGDEPRDLARWESPVDSVPLEEFLAACDGRVIAADPETLVGLATALPGGAAAWSVAEYAGVLAESGLPRSGVTREALNGLGAGEAGPWRAGWRADLGHRLLAPDADHAAGATGVRAAVQAGLAWLELRTRVGTSDPALRAGIGCLARRGDPAAAYLYRHLVLDDPAARAVDEAFAPWTLPLLWSRPDPFAARPTGAEAAAEGIRPDLGRNDLALVSTGRPGPVLAAWGEGRHRWRVVLDRLDRLDEVAVAAAAASGPATLIPAGGLVHDLGAALAWLDDMLPGGARTVTADDGLVPLCHWQRLVTTHNGDLLDVARLRPWAPGAFPVLDRYAHLVADLPRRPPRLEDEGTAADWSAQFAQRVRRAGCVCGLAADLSEEDQDLDATWGVFEGSGASWIFLDAAAVHVELLRRGDPSVWHARLHARGGRHLSVLTGAVFARAEVEARLARWLEVYGPASTLALTDLRPPLLLLTDRGVAPTAVRLAATGLAAAMQHVRRPAREGAVRVVLPPATGLGADFWRECAPGFLADDARCRLLAPGAWPGGGAAGHILTLPVLAGMALPDPPTPAPSFDGWATRDRAREEALATARSDCSLELAAHLAGRWDAVEVLDPRWWTMLPAATVREEPWTGEKALALLAPGAARCFDLPGAAPGAAPAAAPDLVDEIRAWLAGRGDWQALTGGEGEVRPGRHLEVGQGRAVREALLAAVETEWESGNTGSWLLCVAEAPWSAAARAGGALARGQSVWTRDVRFTPGPVLWARPTHLLDPAFVAAVGARPPLAVLVPEIAEWLPAEQGDARTLAVALRAALALPATSTVLQSESLEEPWARYLVAAADVQVVRSAAPAAPPITPGQDCDLPAARIIARLRRLLAGLGPLLERRREGSGSAAPDQLASTRELVGFERLSALAGLPVPVVRRGLAVLRWAAGLAGDSLSAAGDGATPETAAAGGHALLIKRRFAELENDLNAMAGTVDLFLSLWLGGLPAGARTRVDLAAPPAEIDAAELRRLDIFLLGLTPEATGLSYTAPDGVLGTNRRLLALSRPPAEVRTAVQGALELFGRRLREVMGSAVETAAGFLVETGLDDLRPDEESFLGLGAALDEWRWLGPGGAGAVHLVDLLTLADSPTAKGRGAAWQLAGELLGAPPDAATPAPDRSRSRTPGRWWSLLSGERQRDVVAAGSERVAAVAGLRDDEVFLVLNGPGGSGRGASVLAGLADVRRRGEDPGPVAVCCPDTAAAARWTRSALRLGMHLDVYLPDVDLPPPDAPAAAWAPAAGRDVVVMVEAQRFPPEMRYRTAQAGRGRRLIMTVDQAAGDGSWENLFLTTPRAASVIHLTGQHDQARRLWSAVRQLCDEGGVATVGASRSEKGRLATEYAANLDQCLARIRSAHAEGFLTDEFRVTAPLAEDVAFLGRGLRDQGWLAVDEEALDALFLPGACELLAAAADLLADTGELARVLGPHRTGGADDGGSPEDLMLLRRLPAGAQADAAWPGPDPRDPARITLGTLYRELVVRPDLAAVFDTPVARLRAERLVAAWGDPLVGVLPSDPVFLAWCRLLSRDLGVDAPPAGRPLVLLAPSSRTPGPTVSGGVHLCLGSEDPRLHYRVLSRVADSLLVLYQERSPLPGETGP